MSWSAMMTPQACLPVLRTMPSMTRPLVVDGLGDFVALDFGGELGGFFDGVFEGDVELVGDHLGELVGLGEFDVVHAGEVADDHLRAEGAEGDDVGDAVFAVFVADVVDHFVAAAHAEIDVEVGRGDALEVEHPLEEQAEAERVDVGDLEDVGDDTACAGTTTGADGDALLAGPVDEVPDDEEVIDEAGAGDDGELVFELFAVALVGFGGGIPVGAAGIVVGAVALLEAFFAELEEVESVGLVLGAFVVG